MRAILLILILAVVALIAAFATGMIDIDQTRPAQAPQISAGDNGVAAKGGQPPAFEVETGSVAVGTTEANVVLPKVRVEGQATRVEVPAVKVQPADRDQPAENKAVR